MISVSKLWCDQDLGRDDLRYGVSGKLESALERKPVVVWNCTRRCNLACVHCYTDSHGAPDPGELTFGEGKIFIDQLADFGVPVLLFSGGEPLMREDLFDLMEHASSRGLRTVLSTNGTLLDARVAQRLAASGVTYVGISLDGTEEVHDRFRGVPGAFCKAVSAFERCAEASLRTGLRLTLTRETARDLPEIFGLVEDLKIDRVCFYHLVVAGRGRSMQGAALTHEGTRRAVDLILQRADDFKSRGIPKEILTVDQHADGVYIYLKMKGRDPERADEIYRLLEWNGGGRYSSGVGIGCVDWLGDVHPDQFWLSHIFGNVRERPFDEIWTDESDSIMRGLKERLSLLKGRCGECRYQALCGGSLRSRAVAVHGDPWAEDPGCYLTNEEIGIL